MCKSYARPQNVCKIHRKNHHMQEQIMAEHLIYMLSKIEFGRISASKFDSSKDEVIEKLRRDFPVVRPYRNQNTFRFEIKPEGKPELLHDEEPVITLLSANKSWGIRISPSAIMLHTNKYKNFADFRERILKIVEAVHQSFDLTHLSFVGMRYVNAFNLDVDVGFASYFKRMDLLQPEMKSWGKAGSNLNARYLNGDNLISLNSGVTIGGSRYPADLADLASDIDDVTVTNEGVVAHLDIDSFYSTNELVDFSIDFISEKIAVLRQNADAVFYETIIVK